MQAKRFIVPNMKEGLKTVREVLGEDALIVSNKKTAEGVEIIAGIAEEPHYASLQGSAEVLLNAQTKQKQEMLLDAVKDKIVQTHMASEPVITAKPVVKSKPKPKTNPYATEAIIEEVYPEKSVLAKVSDELHSIRYILSNQVQDLAWKQYELGDAFQAQVAKTMIDYGFNKTIARQFAQLTESSYNLKSMLQKVVHAISDQVLLQKETLDWSENINVIIGPSGGGKTQLIGKIIPQLLNEYAPSDIAMISLNETRLGQFDELLVYANVFKIEAVLANDVMSLENLLRRFQEKKIILIDASAKQASDLLVQYKQLIQTKYTYQMIGVLPANLEYAALEHWASVFHGMNVNHIFATKLDESFLKGHILNIVLSSGFSLQALSDNPSLTHGYEALSKKSLINILRVMYEQYESEEY